MMVECIKKEFIDGVQKQCSCMEGDCKQFYRMSILNHTSCIKGGIRKSDILAEWLCGMTCDEQNELLLMGSHMNKYEKQTVAPIHKREDIVIRGTKREEENIAKRMMQLDNSIIDYQVPINRVNHSSEGKVDLVFKDNGLVIIGELKDWDSKETLLRAMIEIRTYQLKIEKNEFVKKRFKDCYGCENVKAAVLMFDGTQPCKDYCMMRDKMKNLYNLAKQWGIMFYEVKNKGDDKQIKDLQFEKRRLM